MVLINGDYELRSRREAQPFQWTPGDGYDEEALTRLQRAFPRPKEPMGEAWFMGKTRSMYTGLMGDLDALSVDELVEPLSEIATGTRSFGPFTEWTEWFHYLLGHLVPRSHVSDSLLETLITAFMSLYPDGIDNEPYRGFGSDVLNTLGRCMMDRTCWADGRIVVGRLLHGGGWSGTGGWPRGDASGDFSASDTLFARSIFQSSRSPPG